MDTAVLVIDMQQALCSGEEAAHDIERVTQRVNGLTRSAREARAPVFLVQHEEDEGSLQYGTEGWQLARSLETAPGDIRLRKRACDSFLNTELQALLQQHGVRHLVICGLQTDFCVDTTVRRALSLGYDVTLAADAHSTCGNGVLTAPQIVAHHNRVLGNLQNFGPRMEVKRAGDLTFSQG